MEWPTGTPQSVWGSAPTSPAPTLDTVLLQWQAAKEALEAAKEAEMNLRKLAFSLGFGVNAQEGTNTVELGNGYQLKGVKKLNYKLVSPKEDVTVLDAVDDCIERFVHISNEGSFIADRLFKWSVDLSKTEYNRLEVEATTDPIKKKLLDEANKVILITEAAPTLEIKAPKVTK